VPSTWKNGFMAEEELQVAARNEDNDWTFVTGYVLFAGVARIVTFVGT
jgi:hypothetical protein